MKGFEGLLGNPMFQAGMGILSANAPSLTPPNYMGGAMKGLMQGAQYAQQQKEMEMKKKLYDLQVQEAEDKRKANLANMTYLANMPTNNLTPEEEQTVGVMSLEALNTPPSREKMGEYMATQAPTVEGRIKGLELMQPETAEGLVGQYQQGIKLGYIDPEQVSLEKFRQTSQQKTINEINMPKNMIRVGDYLAFMGEDGEPKMKLIEGSKTWEEKQEKLAESKLDEQKTERQEKVKATQKAEQADVILNNIGQIRNIYKESKNDLLPSIGTGSFLTSGIANSPAGQIKSRLETLQSNAALGTMMRLKEASSTGSTGFGALNLAELEVMIKELGALDPQNTHPDIILETLDRFEGRYMRAINDIKENVSPENIKKYGLEELIANAESSYNPNADAEANAKWSKSSTPPQWVNEEDRKFWALYTEEEKLSVLNDY